MKDFSSVALRSIKEEFLTYFEILLHDVNKMLIEDFHIPGSLRTDLCNMIRYNALGGKMVRGLFAVYCTYAMSDVWEDGIKKQAFVVGWCAELLQAAFLIADDIMDESTTRRGKTSWYCLKSVGMMSINDSFLLQTILVKLIQKQITDKDRCSLVLRIFEDIKFRTEIGQMLDLNTIQQETKNLRFDYFTRDYYDEIITNKTAYYTIFLPIYLGLALSHASEATLRSPVLASLCLQLGKYFQVKDDYLDVFADASVLGKEGSDIQEGKCSWVAITFLSLCTEEERNQMKLHYGKKDEENVLVIRGLLNRYDFSTLFQRYEEDVLFEAKHLLASSEFPEAKLQPLFEILIRKLFGRF